MDANHLSAGKGNGKHSTNLHSEFTFSLPNFTQASISKINYNDNQADINNPVEDESNRQVENESTPTTLNPLSRTHEAKPPRPFRPPPKGPRRPYPSAPPRRPYRPRSRTSHFNNQVAPHFRPGCGTKPFSGIRPNSRPVAGFPQLPLPSVDSPTAVQDLTLKLLQNLSTQLTTVSRGQEYLKLKVDGLVNLERKVEGLIDREEKEARAVPHQPGSAQGVRGMRNKPVAVEGEDTVLRRKMSSVAVGGAGLSGFRGGSIRCGTLEDSDTD